MNSSYMGIACGHKNNIKMDGDAHCIECSDGTVDVCCACFAIHSVGESLIQLTESPYPLSYDYWYAGTVTEFRQELFDARKS